MKEIEVKILEINVTNLEKKLFSLNANLVFSDVLEAVYFNLPSNFPNAQNMTIRIRKEGNINVLTLKTAKEQVDNIKIREEIETEFENFENLYKILTTLGLTERLHIKKYRKIYELNNEVKFMIDIHLDDLSYIPPLLEIEVKDVSLIEKYVQLLDFNMEQCCNFNVFELINYYSTKIHKEKDI